MHPLESRYRIWVFPLFLFVGSCMNDPGGGAKPPTGNQSTSGSFQVSLLEAEGYTSVLGRVFSGPSPSSIVWKEAGKSGSCKVLTPRVPFCETPCGSAAACVEDNKCQDFPKPIGVGKVVVKGLKTKSGATSFTMDPIQKSYQPPGGVIVDFPPFAEGDAVTISAGGDTAVGAFSVSAPGITPLKVLNDTITLLDGKPINLEWTAPGNPAASTISVKVDISHHGGSKGKIECEGPDTGRLEISASLVDQLKALGVSGFPEIEITRKSAGTNPVVHVDLILESMVSKFLSIPGLISCNPGDECPAGQTCQQDLQCK